MNNKSIWEDQVKIKKDKSNKIINNTDILIIGGGITGLTTAYFLKDSNRKVTLIDKSSIGMGITSKTTAKVTYLQQDIYSKLSKSFNKKISKSYLTSQIYAIKLMLEIIKNENIKCDLEECSSYIFTKEEKNVKKIEKEKEILEEFGIDCFLGDSIPIKDFPVISSLRVNDTYTINPLKYIDGIKKSIKDKVNIYENILAKNISFKDDKIYVETNTTTFICNDVIICNWYPFFIFPGLIPIKTYIKREYVNVAKYKHNRHFTAINIDNNLHSIRFYKDYIIYGSNSHRLTNKINYQENYLKSRSDFKRLFSKEPEYTWMNQDVMSNDYLPLIGRVNTNKHVFIATAFNAWGMTNATLAGNLLSDLVLNKENIYEDLFSPRQISMPSIINSFIGIFHYAKVYIQTTIKRNPVFYNDKIYTVKINGKYYGVYIDNYDKKHIVYLKCPHMKCNLVFNNYEKTWDCPCHGSRFDIDGNIINGPSK